MPEWWEAGLKVPTDGRRPRDVRWYLNDRFGSTLVVTYDLRTQTLYARFEYLDAETSARLFNLWDR